ncbi:MAG TPA: GT4 family glycosyltransferase PelF [Pseudonocardiaceae bacterium]|jgi:glycosyltransferase involved in cell wall biosynthesis|nr:GT4 family glycosyltransferase PelF [Pseudonocardiaceae bacterium]
MDIALMTEGTYPHSFGGVSVWCDQLVRGMPEHPFHLVALVGAADERVAWELPANVASVTAIPLWDNHPVRRPGRTARRRFGQLIRSTFAALLDDTEPEPSRLDWFADSLRALFEYGQEEDLSGALRTEDTMHGLLDVWHDVRPDGSPPTVYDAVTGLQLLEHSLRPLSAPPVRADVSHCVANGLAALPALTAKWVYGTPILLTEHGIYLRERYLGYRNTGYRWPVKALHLAFLRGICVLAYREAGMLAPGNMYNQRWEERLGAKHALIRTVYNGVDPNAFPPVEAEPEVPTVSWAGRIDPIKDLDTLLRSFALVHKQIPEARLRVFGGTPAGNAGYLEHCRTLTKQLGIAEVTTFEGRVAEIRDAYVAGHVVVLSSISEGFPYTVIEAMTCGRPCVATDVGGVSEAIGDTGAVVPPRDPEAMAAACVELLTDHVRRLRLGIAARQRVLEFFTLDKAIDTFDEIYRGLTGGTVAEPEPADEFDELNEGAVA